MIAADRLVTADEAAHRAGVPNSDARRDALQLAPERPRGGVTRVCRRSHASLQRPRDLNLGPGDQEIRLRCLIRLRRRAATSSVRALAVRAPILMVLLMSCSRHHVPAQAVRDVRALEIAAAEYAVTYIYESRPKARVALDTVVSRGSGRSPTSTAELVRIMRAVKTVGADSAITCGALPSTCRIRPEIDAVVSIEPREVTDSSATVAITLRAATGLPRTPIVWETRTVRFVVRDRRWAVDHVETIEVS